MSRRWPALIVIAALLVAGGLADRGHHDRLSARRSASEKGIGPAVVAPLAVAAPAGALSSTWFCAAGTARPGGVADATIVVANPGSRSLSTEVTVVGDSGRSRTRQFVAPPRGRLSVPLRTILSARSAAAVVEVLGGGVSVDRVLTGALGREAAPCASRSSDRWYFAAGSTLRGADEYLALFNPYPDDASVDMTFSTEAGVRAPRRLQAYPVPGRSLRVVHLNAERVNRHSRLAAEVVARSGRLVVDRLQTFDGTGDPVGSSAGGASRTPAPRGLAASTGVAGPATSWAFPAGGKVAGEREQIVVFNPSSRETSVDIAITFDDPKRNGSLDPVPLSVPEQGVKVFDVTDQATVPDGVGHSITVRSTDGVPVVAERVLTGGAPWKRVGASVGPGSPVEATTWLFAAGGTTPDRTEQLVVQNLSGVDAKVDVTVLAGPTPVERPELQGVSVPGRARATVVLDALRRTDLTVVLTSSVPVVAERAIYGTGRGGISIAPGVPLPAGVRALPPAG